MQDGITALGYASLHGHRNVVDTLIAAKADVNLCSRVSRILLCFFFLLGELSLFCLSLSLSWIILIIISTDPKLLSLQYNYTPLYCASEGGHEAIVQTLIDAGGDTNAQTFVSRIKCLICYLEEGKKKKKQMRVIRT